MSDAADQEEAEWPWATIAISALICAFYLAESFLGLDDEGVVTVMRTGAVSYATVFEAGEWWRLLSAPFVHGGLVHMLLNGTALIQVGALIEELYGRERFLVVYLLSCLGSSLATSTVGMGPSVGASGGIMGLIGFLIAARYVHEAPVAELLRQVLGRQLIFWALFVLVVGGSLQLAYWLHASDSPIIDNYGHIGGLVTGMALALAVRSTGPPGVLVRGAALVLVAITALSLGLATAEGGDSARLEQAFMDTIAALKTSDATGMRRGLDAIDSVPDGRRRVVGRDFGRAQALALAAIATVDTRDAIRFAELAAGLDPVRGGAILAQARGQDDAAARAAIDRYCGEAPANELLETAAAFEEQGRSSLAVRFYEALVAREPENADYLNALAWALLTSKDVHARDSKRALVLARHAVELLRPSFLESKSRQDQRSAAILDTLAEAEFQEAHVHEALEHQARAVELGRASRDPQIDVFEERLRKIQAAAK